MTHEEMLGRAQDWIIRAERPTYAGDRDRFLALASSWVNLARETRKGSVQLAADGSARGSARLSTDVD